MSHVVIFISTTLHVPEASQVAEDVWELAFPKL